MPGKFPWQDQAINLRGAPVVGARLRRATPGADAWQSHRHQPRMPPHHRFSL